MIRSKRTKRMLIRFFLVVQIFLLLFSGCSKNESSGLESLIKSPKKKEVTLKFRMPGHPNDVHPDREIIFEEIEKRISKSLNVRIEYKILEWDKYGDEMKKLFKSGEVFDVFVSSPYYPINTPIAELAKDDYLLDISSLFPDFAPNLSRKYSGKDLIEATYKDKLLAIPSLMPGSNRVCAKIDQDVMDKYKIKKMETLDDLELFLKTVKENEPEITPMFFYGSTYNLKSAFGYFEFGSHIVYKWYDADMKLIPWEQTSEYRELIARMKKWYTLGYATSNPSDIKNRMYVQIGDWNSMQEMAHKYTKFNERVYPLYPKVPATKISGIFWSLAFNKKSENPERALGLLDWIHSKQENYDLFMCGLKDTNYTLEKDRIKMIDNTKPYYGWPAYECFLDFEYMRPTVADPSDFKEQYKKFVLSDALSLYPPTTGFKLDSDMKVYQEQISARYESFRNFEQDMVNRDIDMFITEQKKSSINDLVNEMQKQLDEWRKMK